MDYYFAQDDQQKGPFPRESLVAQGMKPDSLVWREGMASWVRADSIPELREVLQGPGAGAASPAGDPYASAAAPQSAYAPAPAYGSPSPGQASYPPAAGGQQLPYGGYAPVTVPPQSGMAIASMILGILSIPTMCGYGLGTPFAITAVILGHIARGQCRRGQASGEGMAMAGLICGYISLGLLVIGLFLLLIGVGVAAMH